LCASTGRDGQAAIIRALSFPVHDQILDFTSRFCNTPVRMICVIHYYYSYYNTRSDSLSLPLLHLRPTIYYSPPFIITMSRRLAMLTKDSRRCLLLLEATTRPEPSRAVTARAISTRLRVCKDKAAISLASPSRVFANSPSRGPMTMMNLMAHEQQNSRMQMKKNNVAVYHPPGQLQQRDDFSTEAHSAAVSSSVEATLEQILAMQRSLGEETQESFESVVRSLVMTEDRR
jgi:hypothetical protein